MSNSTGGRRRARALAMQALFQCNFTQDNADEVLLQFDIANDFSKVDKAYFTDLVQGTIAKQAQIDEAIKPILDRSLASLNPLELSVLRMSVYEFMEHPEVPYRVVINEACDLTKEYGAADGHKYINGVLDKLAKQLRPNE